MINLGSTPAYESCAQLLRSNQEAYTEQATKECLQFITAIRRVCGSEPEGAKLVIQENNHDFGKYLEVVVTFEENQPKAVRYAVRLEKDVPSEWSPEDRESLGLPAED